MTCELEIAKNRLPLTMFALSYTAPAIANMTSKQILIMYLIKSSQCVIPIKNAFFFKALLKQMFTVWIAMAGKCMRPLLLTVYHQQLAI